MQSKLTGSTTPRISDKSCRETQLTFSGQGVCNRYQNFPRAIEVGASAAELGGISSLTIHVPLVFEFQFGNIFGLFYFIKMYCSSLMSLPIWHMICLIINYERVPIVSSKFLSTPAKEWCQKNTAGFYLHML